MKKYIICFLFTALALVVGICGILVNNERDKNQLLETQYTQVVASMETLNLAYSNLYDLNLSLEIEVNDLNNEVTLVRAENALLEKEKQNLVNQLQNLELENGQTVQELQAQISALEEQITANNTTIENLEMQIVELQAEITSLETEIESLKQSINQGTSNLSYVIDRTVTEITAEDLQGITTIGSYAFYGCSQLTSVELPNTITSIGQYAFDGCRSLTSIEIPNSVVSIGQSAFHSCSGLKNVTFQENSTLTELPNNCFAYCRSLTNIDIPDSVRNLNGGAFSFTGLTSITIGENIKTIESSVFKETTALTQINFNAVNLNDFSGPINSVFNKSGQSGDGITVIFGDNVKHIPAYLFYPHNVNATNFAPKITSVVFGNSVETIGKDAFGYIKTLTNITLSASLTSIGENAFYNCSNLTTITVLAETPPTFNSNALPTGLETINIPAGTINAYQTAEGWSTYADKFVELSA